MRKLISTASEQDAGRQVKYFVRGALGVSHRQFHQAKAAEGIRVNGAPVHANYSLRSGDVVEVYLPDFAQTEILPDPTPINVVWEDEDYCIIDKPAPLACQCSARQNGFTLENRYAAHYGPGSVFRPLNRLDKGTSGLMAAAKNAHAFRRLQLQLHTDSFLRAYTAVTEGMPDPPEGVIDLKLTKAPEASIRRVVDPVNGKRAVTHYSAEALPNGRAFVRLRLETGRTHQIRAHLAAIGCPICGDFLYGTELSCLPGRFALHASHLAFDHPFTGERVEFTSPMPEELLNLLRTGA